MPNSSYVARKLKPLGIEFKDIVGDISGVMMWLEIQEGKNCMRTFKHTQPIEGPTMCVLRRFNVRVLSHDDCRHKQ